MCLMKDGSNPVSGLALLRYRAVSAIQMLLDDNHNLTEALTIAACRPWPDCWGRKSGRSTLERWWYDYADAGLGGLERRKRRDEGATRALSEEECSFAIQ